ncbi:glycosyltransferase family protein [Algoriphagus aquimarinus]|uniref:Glycosyltransferase family 4 protein n=1 Tax=Algoriphagus aquimarinus TaxID=237018 RepID=A0A1I0ZYX3_9BACT|nr:hypothetical protein [Algoriphagus aquimarinus]SFB30767.1 hypothetical protein SAMN04489723_10745 [Algoriphagus aquimarinus]
MNSDPRVLRQIAFFRKYNFEIVLSGLTYQGSDAFYPLVKEKSRLSRAVKLGVMVARLCRPRVKEFLHNSSFGELSSHPVEFDLIIANDAETWPLAIALKDSHANAKIVFDAHEFYPRQFTDDLKWNWFHKRFANFLCKKFIRQADVLITVCDGLADAYSTYTSKEIPVVLNAPKYQSKLKPNATTGTIRLVHHGIANRSRKIEKMIELMDSLDSRFELNFMLMPTDEAYFQELKIMSEGKAINFLDTVETEAIPSYLNQFDIGLFYLEPVNFNYTFALPNKFFEFIQARLAIAIGPSTEMKRIVEKESLGVVAEEFDVLKLAYSLNSLTSKDIDQLKANTDRVARKYSADQHDNFYLELIQKWKLHSEIVDFS